MVKEIPKQELKQILDAWWDTEPFGFDHPLTYKGIYNLMQKSYQIAEKDLEEEIKNINKFSSLTSNLDKIITILEFYADENNYIPVTPLVLGHASQVSFDNGKRAQAALQILKEEE